VPLAIGSAGRPEPSGCAGHHFGAQTGISSGPLAPSLPDGRP